MIDEDLKKIIERKMKSGERLVWTDEARGGSINRYGLFVTLFNVFLMIWSVLYLKDHPRFGDIFFNILFFVPLFYALKFLRITFAPRFESYGLSNKHLYIVRSLIFRNVQKFPVTVETHAHIADWSGPNDVIVHWKKVQRSLMSISFDFKAVVLQGLSDPQAFIDALDEAAVSQ